MIVERFRVVRLLGAGGMGEVYQVEDSRLDRRLAIKVLSAELARDPHFLKRFREEGRAASALNHPNVCIIHEVGELEDGCPFIAMEFIEGEPLNAKLKSGTPSVGEIVDMGIQIADALDAAHAKGIVHRDIKPSNICVDEGGRVKVLDFGLAKRMGEETGALVQATSLAETQTGTLMGTPFYMSPEQVLGRPLDHRSDIFSFGALLYELITGRPPFAGTKRRRNHRAHHPRAAGRDGALQLRSAGGPRPDRAQVRREESGPTLSDRARSSRRPSDTSA